MTVANLRGLKESGALFAPPTYVYIVSLIVLIVVGLFRIYVCNLGPINPATTSIEAAELAKGTGTLSLMMLLRAFSSGAVALSGVEAVSNGVPAFKKPESKNAAHTLIWMGVILGTCFMGVSILASKLQPIRSEHDGTGIALMAEHDLRRQGHPVLDHAGLDVRDLDPRGQHGVRRLPPAVVDHRPRRVPATAVLQPWRPPRVLQRRHLPGRSSPGS